MANGKRGDHPLSDYTIYKDRRLPDEILELVDQIRAIDPEAFYEREYPEPWSTEAYAKIHGDWFAWEKGEKLDEAREFLLKKLADAQAKADR